MFFRFTGNLPSVGCAEFIFDEVGQAGHVGSYYPLHIRITQTQLHISDAVEGNDENNALPAKYAADGVHPNLECYKIMEEIILQYL